MPAVTFTHSYAGTLTIDTGVDMSSWGYGLNTQTYPTYGGEVVQILSVYIEDLTLSGTVSSYAQLETIYRYFAKYLIAATQGHNKTATANESYNLDPMIFTYGARNWKFFIYPKSLPGYTMQRGAVGPQWQLQAHVIDDSPDLSVIKDGIKAAATKSIASVIDPVLPRATGIFNLTGNISPKYGNPNADPFQTSDPFVRQEAAQASQWADFYNSLIPAYMKGDFSSLTGVVGSQPNFGTRAGGISKTINVSTPKKSHK